MYLHLLSGINRCAQPSRNAMGTYSTTSNGQLSRSHRGDFKNRTLFKRISSLVAGAKR